MPSTKWTEPKKAELRRQTTAEKKVARTGIFFAELDVPGIPRAGTEKLNFENYF
jgi:hypothetical protein